MFIFKIGLVKCCYVITENRTSTDFKYYRVIFVPPNNEGYGFSLLVEKELANKYNYKSKEYC